jgi:eukaryotic-like serine/threonine-protein kinase
VRGEVIGERYRLERPLGQGSMAEVWLAEDLELQRPVALKLLAPDADRARFEREARAAATLSHPNVTRIYDYGVADGRPFMALEYASGGTLEERLPDRKPMRDDEAAAIAVQLAAGLAHAHAAGLVHRDLKPGNVLFDEEDRPKIADFGIARIGSGSTLTEAGTVLGTAAYISPEQAAGDPATPASDVYSFGIVLYRMLTGRLPFEADTPLELVEMHRRLDAPPIGVLRPSAPPTLAAVAEAALSLDAQRRPADGAALAAALSGDTATSQSDSPTILLPGRPHPRSRLALLLAALVLAAAGGTAGAFLLTRNESSSPGTSNPRPTHAARATTHANPTKTPSTTAATTPAATSTPTTTPATTESLPTTLPTTVTTATLPTTVATTATIQTP